MRSAAECQTKPMPASDTPPSCHRRRGVTLRYQALPYRILIMPAYNKKILLLFLVCLILPTMVVGKGRTISHEPIAQASELQQACATARAMPAMTPDKRRANNPRCDRFLTGLLHTLQMAQRGYAADQPATGQLQLSRCIDFPEGTISLAKLRDIIINFGERHAEMLHLSAFEFATAALAAWFPCSPSEDDEIPSRFNQ